MSANWDIKNIRIAIRESLPKIDPFSSDIEGTIRSTYVPPSHAKALEIDNAIVIGIRGAGKTFWTQALASEPHRQYIRDTFPEMRIPQATVVTVGFGEKSDRFPNKDTLADLLKTVDKPRHIWRAVIATHLAFPQPFPAEGEWLAKVSWVTKNSELFQSLLENADCNYRDKKQTHLILFDALDRLADDWEGIRPLAKSLFQVALEIRSLTAIRCKLFVRPDMLEDDAITSFPDASKLLAQTVNLSWNRESLYALLFQCLSNHLEGGNDFRTLSATVPGIYWGRQTQSGSYELPFSLCFSGEYQKSIFHKLAGPAMGPGASGHKRGLPYTWLVNHLMDGRDEVSPRSFCAALRKAEEIATNTGDISSVINYKGIQAGVQAASKIRRDEIVKEDYPWVRTVLEPFKNNITVPCDFADMQTLWEEKKTLQNLQRDIQTQEVKLPPLHLDKGTEGLLEDLISLGIVQEMSNKRIQMPDVYRIAFGLKRRGGVKPLR